MKSVLAWQTRVFLLAALAAGVLAHPGILAAQDRDGEAPEERRARLERRGAGLRAGSWMVTHLHSAAGAAESEWPYIEGYFQHGLDRHLALENAVGVWRRHQEITETGPLGGTTESVTSYLIPMFTSLKVYPLTTPAHRVEPYALAGAGFALGIDDRETVSGGGLGLGDAQGIAIILGFALQAGAGVEMRLGETFGIAAGGRFQWVRTTEELGGGRTFQGWALTGGLTYRFRFD